LKLSYFKNYRNTIISSVCVCVCVCLAFNCQLNFISISAPFAASTRSCCRYLWHSLVFLIARVEAPNVLPAAFGANEAHKMFTFVSIIWGGYLNDLHFNLRS